VDIFRKMADAEQKGPMAKLHKMTRSLSFKFTGNPKEHVSRTAKKPPRPQKLDTDNWIKPKAFLRSSHIKEVPPDNIRLFNNVGDKKSLWSKKVDSHKEKQAINPFSDSFDKEKLKSQLSKDDPSYGRPERHTLSAMRAAAGEAKMRGDICEVCEVIFRHGQRTDDGLAAIQFGQLFSIYNRINDKLVGLLIRARKRDLLDFEGEMLYQGKDDETWVVLTKNINTINVYFGRDGNVPMGGNVDPSVQSTSIFLSSTSGSKNGSRRTSATSISSLPSDMPHAATDTALLLGSAAVAVAGIDPCPDVKFNPCPASSNHSSKETLLETSETTSTKNLAPIPTEPNKSKFSSKGIKSSFRKLVRPLVRKRESAHSDDSLDDEGPSSLSRRGSKMSDKSLMSSEDADARHGVEARWKRVLGVSLAIGRVASLSKQNSVSSLAKESQEQESLDMKRKQSLY